MKYILLFLVASLFAACGSKPEPKTIYIVRHAEKQLTGNDPELSVAGTARSKKLAQILADKEIAHIFSTDYKRTRMTAAPTASEAGVEIVSYDPRDQEEFTNKLKAIEGNVLVVGHSNTVSQLANNFIDIADPYRDLADDEYNTIYVIELLPNGINIGVKTYKDF